jgi:arsenate reductase
MSVLTVYTLAQCSTCRDATRWLREHGIEFREKAIRETPPTAAELRVMLAAQGGKPGPLFNRSGMEYRALGLAAKLPDLSTAEALELLAGNGRLVKRPFVIGRGVSLLGFNAARWAAAFGQK